MDTPLTVSETYISTTEEGSTSGVAWPAIIGGAFAAAGLMLVLSPLGAALGIAWASPWNSSTNAGRAFTVAAASWLIIVQWLSSAFGGYLTGRLRMKWPAAAHTNEIFFRDTMHGFLSWALAAVVAAALLASFAATGSSGQAGSSSPITDGLFRSATVGTATTAPAAAVNVSEQDRSESTRILAMGAANGQIPEDERGYLVQLITSHTGIPVVEAETRIDNALAQERVEARTAARASLYICLSLLIGAFIASAAGALGGMHRDLHYETGRLKA